MNMIRFLALLLLVPGIAWGQPRTSTAPSNCSSNGANTICTPPIGNVTPADQNLNIDQRAPAQTDDSAHNYASPYAFWAQHLTGGGTTVYQQFINNVGYPQWQNVSITGVPLPGDAASVAPLACWATRQVKQSYTGALFKAQFADGTSQDIQQISGGKPDQSTLWALAALHGTGGVFTARVLTWYDQCGVGAAQANATQGTATAQPLLWQDRDGDVAVVYDQWNGTTSQPKSLTISTNLAVTQNAMSVFNVSAFKTTAGGGGAVSIVQIGNTGGTHANQLLSFFSEGLTIAGTGSTGGGQITAAPSLSYMINGATNSIVGIDGWPALTIAGNRGSNALTGGVLGSTTGLPAGQAAGSSYDHAEYLTIAFGSALSAADINAETISIHGMGKTTPQARCNIAVIGESVWEGFHTSLDQGVVMQLQNSLPKSVRINNFAVAGQGIGVTNANGTNITAFPNGAALTYNSGARCNIAIINGGNTNDYYNGSGTPLITAAAELAFINTLVGLAQSAHYSPIYVIAPIDRSGGGAAFYTELAAIRDGLVSGSGYTIVRVDLDPELGTYNSSSANPACFIDGSHLTPACSGQLANDVKAVISQFIRTGG